MRRDRQRTGINLSVGAFAQTGRVFGLDLSAQARQAGEGKSGVSDRTLLARAPVSDIGEAGCDELFRSLCEASSTGILLSSREGWTVFVNDRFCRLFDVSSAQVVGQDRETVLAEVAALAEDKAQVRQFVDFVRPNPALRLIERMRLTNGRILDVTVAPLLGDAGQIFGRAWFFADVTEVVRAEQERSFTSEALEQNVADMAELAERFYHAKNEAEAARRKLEEQQALLERLANTDPLTGLANRRHFMDQAGQRADCQRRSEQPLAVLMIDIDHFKRINDNYGHAVGDDALKMLARLGRTNLRAQDLFGRMGGEEFACLLVGLQCDEARMVAERFRGSVASADLPTHSGPLRMTVSIGVAMLSPHECHIRAVENALKRADTALYEAKSAGRNRTVVAPPATA